MTINVIHSTICDSAIRDPFSGKLNCTGLSDKIMIDQFPHTATFYLIAWLEGVTAVNNHFKISVFNPTGALLGEADGHKLKFINQICDGSRIKEMVFNFNSLLYQSPQDFYTVQIRSQDQLLLSRRIEAMQTPRVIPTTPSGDQGRVKLS